MGLTTRPYQDGLFGQPYKRGPFKGLYTIAHAGSVTTEATDELRNRLPDG